MFGLGKKKEGNADTKSFKVAEKIIKGAEKGGALSVMQQAFMAGLPATYTMLIKKVEKKWGRKPTIEECKESLHKNPGFFKAAKMMGFEEAQLEDMLEGQYMKMFG